MTLPAILYQLLLNKCYEGENGGLCNGSSLFHFQWLSCFSGDVLYVHHRYCVGLPYVYNPDSNIFFAQPVLVADSVFFVFSHMHMPHTCQEVCPYSLISLYMEAHNP